MASSEKFCLRWNDFESNVSTAFRDIREEKDFFDVTLACDDSQVEAHKVILAACSPWFRNILRRNPHQHPLLYLKGVKYKELVCVLNFMYQGRSTWPKRSSTASSRLPRSSGSRGSLRETTQQVIINQSQSRSQLHPDQFLQNYPLLLPLLI